MTGCDGALHGAHVRAGEPLGGMYALVLHTKTHAVIHRHGNVKHISAETMHCTCRCDGKNGGGCSSARQGVQQLSTDKSG